MFWPNLHLGSWSSNNPGRSRYMHQINVATTIRSKCMLKKCIFGNPVVSWFWHPWADSFPKVSIQFLILENVVLENVVFKRNKCCAAIYDAPSPNLWTIWREEKKSKMYLISSKHLMLSNKMKSEKSWSPPISTDTPPAPPPHNCRHCTPEGWEIIRNVFNIIQTSYIVKWNEIWKILVAPNFDGYTGLPDPWQGRHILVQIPPFDSLSSKTCV